MKIYEFVANLFIAGIGVALMALFSFGLSVTADELLRRFDINDKQRGIIIIMFIMITIISVY